MLKAAAVIADAKHRAARTALDAAMTRREATAARLSEVEAERARREQALAQALSERERRASTLAAVVTDDGALKREADRLTQEAARAAPTPLKPSAPPARSTPPSPNAS